EFKIGVILLHDEDSTYDLNFINSVKAAVKELGLKDSQLILKRNIRESNECYEAAEDLVNDGCDIVFADSFGHEDFMIKAAKQFPDVQFCHATGTKAHTEKLSNYHNAFTSIYEGRYLAGVAAGLKLNEMIDAGEFTAEEAKIGYVGAFTYAEVISGYTSFYLGAKSVLEETENVPGLSMEVTFTGSWFDEAKEKESAQNLISRGAALISQHADSMGAPSACEAAGVPNVSYNGSTESACPNTFIVSSRINWVPYFEYMIDCVRDGKAIDTDWCGTIATGSVVLTDFGKKATASDTEAKVNEVKQKLMNGTLSVFDTAKFTVGGKHLTEIPADVDGDYKPETNVVVNGVFQESTLPAYRSAPYFETRIDGITLLNEAK
ncbi:MAG: BMP family ABC transporter substrate-binding protein, partial [Clostridia bacterium]|nr:BMP family ABC transporter substrate-binding protein [Clostridia bacterium]